MQGRKELTNEELETFRKRAVISATRRGFGEFAEDAAQEVLLRFSSGEGQHQTVDQAVVDYLRRDFGRPGTPGFERKRAVNRPTEQVDGVADREIPGVYQSHDFDFERLVGLLKGKQRRIVILRFACGLMEWEIGEELGITESRVSKILMHAFLRLRAHLRNESRRIDEMPDGQMVQVELVERVCKCGCGRKFRVMPTSPQEYGSVWCEPGIEKEHLRTGLLPRVRSAAGRKRGALVVTGNEVTAKQLANEVGVSLGRIYQLKRAEALRYRDDAEKGTLFDLNYAKAYFESKKRPKAETADQQSEIDVPVTRRSIYDAPAYQAPVLEAHLTAKAPEVRSPAETLFVKKLETQDPIKITANVGDATRRALKKARRAFQRALVQEIERAGIAQDRALLKTLLDLYGKNGKAIVCQVTA